MTRRTLLVLAALLLLPVSAFSQEATPKPDLQVYEDPGMHFRAPDGYHLVAQRKVSVDELGNDPEVVSAWVMPDPTRAKRILIQQQLFEGSLSAFTTTYTQAIRDAFQNPVVRTKEPISLRNGMPAMFLEATYGSGFSDSKLYAIVWVDGVRGVALSLNALVGEMDAAGAKRLLSDASAVRYPSNRE